MQHAASAGVLHRLGELRGGQCVEHVVFGQPGAARLEYSKADLFHVRNVVRVGIDDDLYAMLFGLPQMDVI
jgi:hypothetical protein